FCSISMKPESLGSPQRGLPERTRHQCPPPRSQKLPLPRNMGRRCPANAPLGFRQVEGLKVGEQEGSALWDPMLKPECDRFTAHWDAPSRSYLALWRGVTSPTTEAGATYRGKAGGGIELAVQRYADILYRLKAVVLFYCGDRHRYPSDHHTVKAFDEADSLVATFHLQNGVDQDAVYSYGQSPLPSDWPRAPTGELHKWQVKNAVVQHSTRRHTIDFTRVEKEFVSIFEPPGAHRASKRIPVWICIL
ncbi:hypothetical protein DXG01_011646, partial [Tephrocybe rancida]